MDSERVISEAGTLLADARDLLLGAVEAKKAKGRLELDRVKYERWFSRASRVVGQVLPERVRAFTDPYKLERRPARLDVATYTISDYLGGVHLSHEDSGQLVLVKFMHQVAIFEAALDALPSRLTEIASVIRAELFDEELGVAAELAKRGHLRGAGAVAGVVLERHLQQVAANHGIQIRKKHPTIADLNDPLKKADVYDVPTWRRIQMLADIRNLAVHDKGRSPTVDDISELIAGVERAVKSIF